MNLVTPDAGLLFWMTVIFGVVLLLLWKFGFPIITDSLDKRNRRIVQSQWTKDHARMLEETRAQQAEILRKASETGNGIIASARAAAKEQADKILADATAEIEARKQDALNDISREVAEVSVRVAEKILRSRLSDEGEARHYLDTMIDEASKPTCWIEHRTYHNKVREGVGEAGHGDRRRSLGGFRGRCHVQSHPLRAGAGPCAGLARRGVRL